MGAIKFKRGGRFAQSEGPSLPQFEANEGDCLIVGPLTEKSLVSAEVASIATEKEAKAAVPITPAGSVSLERAVAPPDEDKGKAERKAPAKSEGKTEAS